MKPSEISVVVLSDSEGETTSSSIIRIDDESDSDVKTEVEVVTLDDSMIGNNSILNFTIDRTPDFIPIDVGRKSRSKKRKLGNQPDCSISGGSKRRRKCLMQNMVSRRAIKMTNNSRTKCTGSQKPEITLAQQIMHPKQNNDCNMKASESSDKTDTHHKISRIPQIQLSHSNILNTVGAQIKKGLRAIVIDGCNVGFGFGNGEFSVQGIIYVVQYFKERGHEEIVCFLPQNYRFKVKIEPFIETIKNFEKEEIIVYTPTRFLNGKFIKPYDDRFIVQYASEREGVIISNDGYRDLFDEEPSWRTTIEKRIVNFTFVRGLLMLPKDPLGPNGPTLDEMLKFP